MSPDTCPALARQEGGDHYKTMAIQPVEFIHRNGIGFIEGSVIKYVSRWRSKGGVQDLLKARHFLDLLIELESPAFAGTPGHAPAQDPGNHEHAASIQLSPEGLVAPLVRPGELCSPCAGDALSRAGSDPSGGEE